MKLHLDGAESLVLCVMLYLHTQAQLCCLVLALVLVFVIYFCTDAAMLHHMAPTNFFSVMLTVALPLKGRLRVEGCSQNLIYRDTVLLANY